MPSSQVNAPTAREPGAATAPVAARRVLGAAGWLHDATIRVDAGGLIAAVDAGAAAGQAPDTVVVPGMPNLHSHAFQRAMAGSAERAGSGPESFWTWRERMYRLAQRLSPRDLETIATLLYVEMLEAGYTSVAEFHYLHHAPGGVRHADAAAASRAMLSAAATTGIRITLLPVLYMYSGFGAQPPEPEQAAFVHTVAEYLALLDSLLAEASGTVRIGIAFHSLRAVAPAAMAQVLDWRARHAPGCPVHIHVAEQLQEVHECEAWSGRRPVEWLLHQGFIDRHWCLVHATHTTEEELRGVAQAGAVVGLCPTTEANLGDGLFPLAEFLAAGGRFGIGSDSQVSVSPIEELRWLEYGQRLLHGRRSIAASETDPHCGSRLFRAAIDGGSRALGQCGAAVAAGQAADLVMLDGSHPLLAGAQDEELLDRFVFAGNRPLVAQVTVAGREVVREGRHVLADEAAAAFRDLMNRLRAG